MACGVWESYSACVVLVVPFGISPVKLTALYSELGQLLSITIDNRC